MTFFRKQQGFTLVEVLATITILSLVILLLMGILTNGQNQFTNQNEKNHKLQNISYAFKDITKKIRQHPNEIVVGVNELTINGVHYYQNGTNLMKDSIVIVHNIQEFQVKEIANTISIIFKTTSNESFSTQIVKRN